MKVLGIDPGLAACGYGLVRVDGTRVRVVASGCIRTGPRQHLADRLGAIFSLVESMLVEHGADAVAIEESYVGADARTALAVGQARGAAIAAAARAGVECVEYAPARVKSAVCGYGRADKAQVAHMVRTILSLDATPATSHEADALAVAICHALLPPLARIA